MGQRRDAERHHLGHRPAAGDSRDPTSFASPSATSSINQNGSAAGQVDNVIINSSGEIVATFGAGQTVVVGQLAMANFNNPKGLREDGLEPLLARARRRASPTSASPPPAAAAASSAARSSRRTSTSRTEFTQMILAQRGYQANSRSITVADEILVETLQMKR